MDEIRDYKGRLACKGNVVTGDMEVISHGCKTSVCLPIGQSITVERKGSVTKVTRASNRVFLVDSRPLAMKDMTA